MVAKLADPMLLVPHSAAAIMMLAFSCRKVTCSWKPYVILILLDQQQKDAVAPLKHRPAMFRPLFRASSWKLLFYGQL